ncbi:Exportin-4 [Geodia barretti]|uniref:Exportin-4 n=2 Tax=Geodia barretti TaxID=519541 RepID=A0AA35W2C8_GEOBA|nr:Exportin-4 [Geodia barretti]
MRGSLFFSETLQFLKMMTHLTVKDYIDFGNPHGIGDFLSLCRLCMVEKTFISGGLIDILSPQLSSTLVWCLSHVTHPYVHLTEDSYDQVSLPLLSVFGKDAPSSQWLCVFLLDKVTFNLSVWSMEESVAVDTVALLGTLVKNTDRQGEENKLDRKVRLRYH